MAHRKLAAWILVLVVAGIALAGGLSVEDLINLKQAGFSENDIRKEVHRSGGETRLDDAGAKRLREAGFSEAFLAELRGTGPAALTLEAVRAMHGKGASAAEIIQRIAASPAPPGLTPQQALDLARAGVPAAVLRALKPEPLALDELLALARGGTKGEVLEALVGAVGAAARPGPKEALELTRAGVPASLVRKLREGAAGKGPPNTYEHPNGRFRLRHPPGWHLVTDIEKGEYSAEYIFTPDPTGVANEIRHGFSISALPIEEGSHLRNLPIRDILTRFLPAIRTQEPGLQPFGDGKVTAGKLAGLEAAFVQLTGHLADREGGPYRLHLGIARKEGWLYLAGGFAPVAEWDRYADAFGRCADGLRLGPPAHTPPASLPTAQEWVERYKQSVVLVKVPVKGGFSSGTGFVVREDGYVLTNYHVIWDYENDRPRETFEIHWDSSLQRPPARARLIGWRRSNLAKRSVLDRLDEWGADTALLKIEGPGPFLPMPISPLAAAKLSDPILTMGFPLSGTFDVASLSLFVTRGVVVRFNRSVRGDVDSVFIDAKITHGNSGGPCINLATGGVIGQNTFGFDIAPGTPDRATTTLNNLVGYRGVIPIEYALREFPDFLALPPRFDAGWTPQQHLLLAIDFFQAGSTRAAARQLQAVIEIEPGNADALTLLASCAVREGDLKSFHERIDQALRADPDHDAALTLSAQVYAAEGKLAKAAQAADRAVQSRPDAIAPYLTRGRLYLSARRYEDALRDTDRAADLGQGINPEPDILAVQVLYAMGRLEAGRDRMQRALEIAPDDFDALMGYADYFERKEMWKAAVIEYGKIQARYPVAPEPNEALGRAYTGLKREEDAFQAFQSAVITCRALGREIPAGVYQGLVHYFVDVKRNLEAGSSVLVDYLNTHVDSANAHISMAELQARAGKLPGLASAHAVLARMAAQGDKEIEQRAARIPRAPLQFEEVLAMDALGYKVAALAVAQTAPIGFTLDRNQVAQLQGKMTPVLRLVLQTILKRQQEGGGKAPAGGGGAVAGGGGGGGGAAPPPPTAGNAWRDPDGSMRFSIPAGFAPNAQRLEVIQGAGFPWIRVVTDSRQPPAEILAFGFDAQVQEAAQALEALRRYAQANGGMKLNVAGTRQVPFGGSQATVVQGNLQSANGGSMEWEALFVPRRAGLRGIWIGSYRGGIAAVSKVRDALFGSFRVSLGDAQGAGGGAPPPPGDDGTPPPPADDGIPAPPGAGDGQPPRPPRAGGKLVVWKDPAGTMEVAYPRSFTVNREAIAASHAKGAAFISLIAMDRAAGAGFTVVNMAQAGLTPPLAFAVLRDFEARNGGVLAVRAERHTRVGNWPAVNLSGTESFQNGTVLLWEGLLVQTRGGVRALVCFAPQASFQKTQEVRRALLKGFKVLK